MGHEERFYDLIEASRYVVKQVGKWWRYDEAITLMSDRAQSSLTYGAGAFIDGGNIKPEGNNKISVVEALDVIKEHIRALTEQNLEKNVGRPIDYQESLGGHYLIDIAYELKLLIQKVYSVLVDYEQFYAVEYRRIYGQYGFDLADIFISFLKTINNSNYLKGTGWEIKAELASRLVERYVEPSQALANEAHELAKLQQEKLKNTLGEVEALSRQAREEFFQMSGEQDLEFKRRANELADKLEEVYQKQVDDLQEKARNLEIMVQGRASEMKKALDRRRQELLEEQEKFFSSHSEKYDERIRSDLAIQQEIIGDGFKSILAAYDEKVSFTEPVKRWRSVAWWNIGSSVLLGIIFLVISGAGIYGYYTLIKDMPNQPHELLDMKTVKSVALLFFLSAAYFYLVRTIVKMLFSTLHLARDAREREALTHVYLGLLGNNRDNFDENSRDIVYQALFSRSNTGLLGDDSSPTMPFVSVADASRMVSAASRLKN